MEGFDEGRRRGELEFKTFIRDLPRQKCPYKETFTTSPPIFPVFCCGCVTKSYFSANVVYG